MKDIKAQNQIKEWNDLFENKETGLFASVSATQTPEQLKKLSEAILKSILTNNHDKAIRRKIQKAINKLIPENAKSERLPAMQAGVTKLLRKVQQSRFKKTKAPETETKQATPKNVKEKKAGNKKSFLSTALQNNYVKLAILLTLALLMPLGIFLGTSQQSVPEGDVLEHIRLVEHHVSNRLPEKSWIVTSVEQSKKGQISIEILITKPEHIQAIEGMKRMARVAILGSVCPEPNPAIKEIINQGWSLWVNLKSPDQKLTGGTCYY